MPLTESSSEPSATPRAARDPGAMLPKQMPPIPKKQGVPDKMNVKEAAREAARSCPMLFHEHIAKEETSEEKPLCLEAGYRKARLPGRQNELTLVVVRGFGEEPLLLCSSIERAALGPLPDHPSRLINSDCSSVPEFFGESPGGISVDFFL